MSEPRKASDAATRAARKLMDRGFLASKMGVIPETARVIDEETAAPDLLAACNIRDVHRLQFGANDHDSGIVSVRMTIGELRAIRAAILKATGGAQ